MVKASALKKFDGMTAQQSTTDDELIKRIGYGDRQALAELYTCYQRILFAYLLQLTPDYGLAEEILQDTLVAVWQSARGFEGRSSVLTWLIGIARRQAHNTLRRHQIPLADLTETACLPTDEPAPEEAVLASAAREELAEAFRRLAPVHREILSLIFLQELSYQETATVLAIPLGTVKSRLSNARRALRALLNTKEGSRK